jgi:hypothetical protein
MVHVASGVYTLHCFGAGVYRWLLSLSIWPKWVGSTWGRRHSSASETSRDLNKGRAVDSVQKLNSCGLSALLRRNCRFLPNPLEFILRSTTLPFSASSLDSFIMKQGVHNRLLQNKFVRGGGVKVDELFRYNNTTTIWRSENPMPWVITGLPCPWGK